MKFEMDHRNSNPLPNQSIRSECQHMAAIGFQLKQDVFVKH